MPRTSAPLARHQPSTSSNVILVPFFFYGIHGIEQMLFQACVITVNNFADLRSRLRFGADLIEDKPLGTCIVELVEEPGRDMNGLMLFQFELFAVLKSHHCAFALNDEKRMVRTRMAM